MEINKSDADHVAHCLAVGAVKGWDHEFPAPQYQGFFSCCDCGRVPQVAPSFGANLGDATPWDEFFLELSMLT
jgi:hypothetical protein